MKPFKVSLFFFLLTLTLSLFSQTLDGTNNYVNSNNIIRSPIIKTFAPNIRAIERDEYGTTGANTFLGGTGASGGRLSVPDPTGFFNLSTSGTIEAWIMPTATTSSAPGIVAKGEATTVAFLFGYQASTSFIYFRIGNSATVNTGGITAPLNQWSHVAVTWTGTSGNYTVTFYVNGALSGAPVVNTGTWNTSNDSLTVGITKPFSGNTFYGYIDEVKIWNVVRTQSQIAQSRFVGLGDNTATNTGNAITSAANYSGLLSSWTFNNQTRDDIGGKNGYLQSGAGLYWYPYTAGYPMPYNFALCCTSAAGVNDYVTIPENAVFDQTTAGTFEAWIYLNAVGVLQPIFQKGSAFASTTLAAYVTAGNKFGINIGSHNYFPSSSPVTFVANKWYHVAATWSGGPNFTVTTYVNGQQDYTATYNLAMPTATGPAWIGRYYGTQRFNGFIDEVRYWSGARTVADIQKTMFSSCRAILPNASLVGAWNFDGNLINFAATSGINGSFSTGGTNNCRISAYQNESTTGIAPSPQFIAFPTVLNCTAYPNGFYQKAVNMPIPDNSTITDQLTLSGLSGNLTDVQVFLSIQHQKTSDLTVKLKAPNNTEITLSAGQGTTSTNGYLTIMDDSIGNTINTTTYLSPWTNYVKPQNPMTTFGNTALNGNWILSITDGVATNTGVLMGWGIRVNNATLVGMNEISSSTPLEFRLAQNYPNPFNPATKITFSIAKQSKVVLKIFDILGKEVKTLVNENLSPGVYDKSFDGTSFASGVYFYKLEAGEFNAVKKMVLLK